MSTVATGGAAGAAAGGWRPSRGAALLLLTASGFAGLGYQIIWVQQTAVWLGHETAALLAVIGAFFGGLSLGAWAIGPRIERGARPGRAYAACEAIIAGWSLVLAVAIGPAGELLMALTGAQAMPLRQWGVAFGGTFLLLLPATAAMGATLPAMARVLAGDRDRIGPIGALYAANTAGAVLGVLVTTFWLVPQAGLARTALACAAVNALCAVAALAWFDRPAASAGVAVPRSSPGPGDRTVRVRLAATGLLGIGYEVLVVRVLAQVTENTVYTYALLLAAYLVGTALGAAAWQRWAAEAGTHPRRASRLLQALAACCLGGTLALWSVDVLHATLVRIMGGGFGAAIAAEAGIALVVFLPATVVMGALFSELSAQAHAAGVGLGRALGINTLGAAFAPLLFGVVLLPWAGPKLALLAVAAGYLLTSMQARRLAPSAWGLAGAAAALAWWAPPLVFVDLPDGAHLVAYRDGAGASVSVVEDAGGTRVLRINNREQEGSNATRFSDGRQALLPLWLHEMPRSALFLGLGTGVTASVAAIDDRVAVDVVELLPEVVEASRHFADEGEPRGLPRVMVADARRFVRSAPRSYDVIVSDNFHPARSGAASLYTVEHFAAVRERLAPGGLFCQWLPLHQLDLATLRSIVRSFLAAFPDGRALLATYSLETPVLGLIATPDGTGFDLARLRQRLSAGAAAAMAPDFGLDDEWALLGTFVAGPGELAAFAVEAPLNIDDHPVVAHQAARFWYRRDSTPRSRLFELLDRLAIAPGDVLRPPIRPEDARRLADHWRARDLYLRAGRDVKPAADARAMLAQVRAPLLEVLRTAPDFRPAYDPLLRLARAVAAEDPAAARDLLAELARIQPARPEAPALLRQLDPAASGR